MATPWFNEQRLERATRSRLARLGRQPVNSTRLRQWFDQVLATAGPDSASWLRGWARPVLAAATVLADAGEPMRTKAIVEAAIERGLWKPGKGKTPHATLYAAMTREIATKGDTARFRKADRGLFEAGGKEA